MWLLPRPCVCMSLCAVACKKPARAEGIDARAFCKRPGGVLECLVGSDPLLIGV